MSAKNEVGKVEYHYGFYGAIHAEYEPTHVQMEYLQEHELGDEPVRMDMLIIKRDSRQLTDAVGSFFRTHNVLEYKSPEDGLTVDDFYKAQGYALLYKGLGKTVNEIPLDELTVSIFRHTYPRDMFRSLKETGLNVEEASPGVFRVTGAISVPAQVVVMSRLPAGEYSALKVLAKDATKEDLLQVLRLVDSDNPQMVTYVRAILSVSTVCNEELIDAIKEAGIMPEAFRRLYSEELKEEREKGREERSREVYERLKEANMPDDQARKIAFG